MNSATPSMVVAPLSGLVARCDADELRTQTVRLRPRRRVDHRGRIAARLRPTVVLVRLRFLPTDPAAVGVGVDDAAPGAGEHDRAVRQVGGHAPRLERGGRPALAQVLVVAREDPAGDHDGVALRQGPDRVLGEATPAPDVDEQRVAVAPGPTGLVEPALGARDPEVRDGRAAVQPPTVDLRRKSSDDGQLGLVHGVLLHLAQLVIPSGTPPSVQAEEPREHPRRRSVDGQTPMWTTAGLTTPPSRIRRLTLQGSIRGSAQRDRSESYAVVVRRTTTYPSGRSWTNT